MSPRVFVGATVLDGDHLRHGSAVIVEAGRVVAVCLEGEAPAGERIRLAGGILTAGYVDLQVNGGGGVNLNDAPDVSTIETICAAHGRLGTTALLPTLITDRPERLRAAIEAGVSAVEAKVPGFLGLHLEGPHLDPRRKGAHNATLIRSMTSADLAFLIEAAARLPVLMVTVAPEAVTGEQIAAMSAAGVVVSLGHTDTGAEAARKAFAAGARAVTHLFNAMSPLGHREPGLVGAALDVGSVSAGMIADGMHVVPEVIRVALAAKRGPGRVFLVTDAMAVAGTALEGFELDGRRVARRGGRLTLADGTLAGADVDITTALRLLVRTVGVAPEEALRMASLYPSAVIGQADVRGALRPGMVADMVHLGADLLLLGVWRGGEPVALTAP